MRAMLLAALAVLTLSAPVARAEPPAPAPAACGAPGQRDCPMQAWMKAQLQANVRTSDFARLARGLERLVAMEPRGYRGWAEAAKKGLEAAHARDMAGVRASCKSCHDDQRARYRSELRATALPAD